MDTTLFQQLKREREDDTKLRRTWALWKAVDDQLQLNLVKLADAGFYFCQTCEHVVELNTDGPANTCDNCGSMRVRWNPPILEGGKS